MTSGRGRLWDWLTGLAGLVLIVALFLHWYRFNDDNWVGWQTLGKVKGVLLIAGFVAMLTPLIATLRQNPGGVSRYRALVIGIGVLAVAGAAIRIAHPTKFTHLPNIKELATPETAAWVGLGAAIGIVVFSAIGMWVSAAQRPARSTASQRERSAA